MSPNPIRVGGAAPRTSPNRRIPRSQLVTLRGRSMDTDYTIFQLDLLSPSTEASLKLDACESGHFLSGKDLSSSLNAFAWGVRRGGGLNGGGGAAGRGGVARGGGLTGRCGAEAAGEALGFRSRGNRPSARRGRRSGCRTLGLPSLHLTATAGRRRGRRSLLWNRHQTPTRDTCRQSGGRYHAR